MASGSMCPPGLPRAGGSGAASDATPRADGDALADRTGGGRDPPPQPFLGAAAGDVGRAGDGAAPETLAAPGAETTVAGGSGDPRSGAGHRWARSNSRSAGNCRRKGMAASASSAIRLPLTRKSVVSGRSASAWRASEAWHSATAWSASAARRLWRGGRGRGRGRRSGRWGKLCGLAVPADLGVLPACRVPPEPVLHGGRARVRVGPGLLRRGELPLRAARLHTHGVTRLHAKRMVAASGAALRPRPCGLQRGVGGVRRFADPRAAFRSCRYSGREEWPSSLRMPSPW